MPEFFKHHLDNHDTPVVCPACGDSVRDIRYRYVDEGRHSDFFLCRSCTFIFARPVLISELSERHMDGVPNAEMFNSRILKSLYIHLFIHREIRKIRNLKMSDRMRMLDVGCGTGWTSKIFQDHGFIVTGLEPSKVRAQIAKEKYGLTVISDYLENLPADVKYDVIVLRHIIEHFAEPEVVMKKVRSLLCDDGLLLIIIPNINCLGRYIFGTRWSWVLPWHCNFFTPKSAGVFLQRAGFHVLSSYQTPSPLYFPNSLLRVVPSDFLKRLVADHKIGAMLLSAPVATVGSLLGIGDNLNLIACKHDFPA